MSPYLVFFNGSAATGPSPLNFFQDCPLTLIVFPKFQCDSQQFCLPIKRDLKKRFMTKYFISLKCRIETIRKRAYTSAELRIVHDFTDASFKV